ncbi:uncharacterized protein LOC105203984 [Solenopsis invicta]|uniref:uncharacterized protein LOC105203984 n=1 Tax=Solenopsis invicta TaxID=13686 RepID=UPI00193DE24E|nr:uncharacterized protein LOC105203984 [Solenopsis invicta]
MDEHEIIRVGGRIRNAALPYDARHPVLLPKSHRLTILIIQREHVRNLHSGLQVTMHAVRRRFWPLAAHSIVRRVIHDCVTCFKCRPAASQTLMADLPVQRVTVSRPFTHCGVDYAGPMLLKESRRRNARLHKAYISVFVCFSTKAVHLEIVTDLTSETFLGAFKRFMSRRGRPSCMYSDNGTTFVGARKQIKELYNCINDHDTRLAMQRFMRDNEIEWRFIPPHAPHVGGLWEAAVKSAKSHINRVLGNANLTYEEMQTVLCEVEAVLNSRPLIPLSDYPNDLHCITPGHFLIGAALYSFPIADLTEENPGRLLRWQRVEQLRQHFWKRWSAEYLHILIKRQKWRISKGQQLKVSQLAMVQQPGLGPLQWLLGRVQQLYSGPDGAVRTATLRTAKGQITRPLTKLAILPMNEASAD